MSIHLLISSFKTKLINLFYAGLGFLLIFIGQLGDILFDLNAVVDRIFTGLSMILVVIFTNETFHKEQKSIILHQDRESYLPIIFLIFSLINFIIMIMLSVLKLVDNSSLEIHYIRVAHDCFSAIMVFFWLGGSSYHAYKEIKKQDIDPCITFRYKLISLVSFIAPLHQIILIFQPIDVRFGTFNSIESYIVFALISIISAITSIGFLFAWLLPERIKKILRKEYEPIIDKDLSQEELTEIIKYLGEKLAEKIKLSPTAARGLIKLAIQEQIGVFKQFSRISFKSFKEIIYGTLKDRLIKLEIDNVNDVTDDMFNYLIKIQSLITMGSV
ncbi:MAG: hypothetical protein ACFFAT_14665 [Promethearchaeota archaeon]